MAIQLLFFFPFVVIHLSHIFEGIHVCLRNLMNAHHDKLIKYIEFVCWPDMNTLQRPISLNLFISKSICNEFKSIDLRIVNRELIFAQYYEQWTMETTKLWLLYSICIAIWVM